MVTLRPATTQFHVFSPLTFPVGSFCGGGGGGQGVRKAGQGSTHATGPAKNQDPPGPGRTRSVARRAYHPKAGGKLVMATLRADPQAYAWWSFPLAGQLGSTQGSRRENPSGAGMTGGGGRISTRAESRQKQQDPGQGRPPARILGYPADVPAGEITAATCQTASGTSGDRYRCYRPLPAP